MKLAILFALVTVLIAIFFDASVGFAVVLVGGAVLFYTKKIRKKDFTFVLVIFIVASYLYFLYYVPGLNVARGQGTVLSDNWYNALNWVKDNTKECAVVATYWDPGHFITGIGKRAVIFDGASQSDLFTRPYKYTQEGMVVEEYDANLHHIVVYRGGNKTTARIQDVSTTLLTSNETLAVNILREYMKPGCDEMYYIASADLLGKSTWWTYFSTWDPVNKKGTPYNYVTVPLTSAKPDIRQNAIVYTYSMSQQESFVVYQTNSSIVVFLQQQGNPTPLKIEKFIYFDQSGNGRLFQQDDADIQGLLWVEPGAQTVMFIPPQLENALFTRMFLYNGQGLEKFEFVNSWGGEVKLFKVKFD